MVIKSIMRFFRREFQQEDNRKRNLKVLQDVIVFGLFVLSVHAWRSNEPSEHTKLITSYIPEMRMRIWNKIGETIMPWLEKEDGMRQMAAHLQQVGSAPQIPAGIPMGATGGLGGAISSGALGGAVMGAASGRQNAA